MIRGGSAADAAITMTQIDDQITKLTADIEKNKADTQAARDAANKARSGRWAGS